MRVLAFRKRLCIFKKKGAFNMRRKEETISIHGHQLLLRNPVEEEA